MVCSDNVRRLWGMETVAKKVWVSLAVVPLLVTVGLTVLPSTSSALTSAQAPLTSSEAAALSTNVTSRVIVVLKDQVTQYSASRALVGQRKKVVATDQKSIVGELDKTKATNVHSLTVLNAVSATVSPGEAARLAANPAVAEVVPDQVINLQGPLDAPDTSSGTAAMAPVPGTCNAKGAPPLLEPQALQTIGADSQDPNAKTARSLGIDGSGVTVAFIADGLDIKNTDFIRPDNTPVFVDYKDFTGEGTAVPTGGGEAFLDASSIAAQGNNVYDVSKYSARKLNRPCDIRIEGVAPGASLVGLDVFGAEDGGFNSSFLQAIDYAVTTDHVNVLNESLGNNYYPDDKASLDLIKSANDAAVAAGTTVTVSSGDAGVTNTIGTPATDPKVISAGASTTYQLPVTLGYGGSQFGVTGWLDNNISSLSSSGFQQSGATISLVAPGELNWALCSTDTAMYDECVNFNGKPSPVQESGGTSESAPLTAGAAALVIQAYGKTHGGAVPSPALVKQFLTSTADDISAPADLQGSGLLDAYRAVLAAEAYQATPAPTATLLENTSQFNAVAPASTPETFTERLTNVGSTPETVSLSSRTLGAYTSVKTATVTLSDTASPTSVDYQGYTDNYESVTFTVPSGVDRLNGSIAFQASSSALSARVRMALIDPSGRLADYSLPQGIGNYGNAQVANPEAGTWTAYIWSRNTAGGGTTGPVLFGASTANYKSFGAVSPSSVTIKPGKTSAVTLTTSTPSTPGDTSGSIVVGSSGQPDLAIPVTLRSLAPTGTTSFGGVLTGGNGRASFTGVTQYYQFDIPSGDPAINASVTLAKNPNNQLNVYLIDPSGQAQAVQSNGLIEKDSSGTLVVSSSLGASAHVINPVAGRWTMIVVFAPTVSGTALSDNYTVALNEDAPAVTATGVPSGGKINTNHPAVVKIKVTNNSTSPEAYFVDGRTNATVKYSLVSLSSPNSVAPLRATGNIPVFLVPSQTSAIRGTSKTTGSTPIQFDMGAPSGDPDVSSNVGSTVTAAVSGNPVTAGEWDIAPDVSGAFGPDGVTPENVTSTMTATTLAFDPAVSSSTGDLWQASIGGAVSVSPIIVQPGHTATIPVLISPSGTPGTTVSGTLYLDSDSLFSVYSSLAPNANTLAAIPYSYVIL